MDVLLPYNLAPTAAYKYRAIQSPLLNARRLKHVFRMIQERLHGLHFIQFNLMHSSYCI